MLGLCVRVDVNIPLEDFPEVSVLDPLYAGDLKAPHGLVEKSLDPLIVPFRTQKRDCLQEGENKMVVTADRAMLMLNFPAIQSRRITCKQVTLYPMSGIADLSQDPGTALKF